MSESGKDLYLRLETQRHSYLERARDCARLTLPHLITDEGDQAWRKFATPYQAVGARGVNNLASSLLLSLLPPNAPFFRFVIDAKAAKNLENLSPKAKGEAEQSLSEMERLVMREIESLSIRVALFEALKQLIVTGNVLLYFPDEGPMRVIRLDRFVVKRDPMGHVRRIVIKENVAPAMLPPEIQAVAKTCMCVTKCMRKNQRNSLSTCRTDSTESCATITISLSLSTKHKLLTPTKATVFFAA